MKHLLIQPDFEAWREAARDALRAGYRPEEIDLADATVPNTLTLVLETDESPTGDPIAASHSSRAFLEAARFVAVHRDPQRWNLLYRVLFRLQQHRHLMQIETDDDVAALLRLSAQVHRDLHKMHAFVRFRKVLEPSSLSARPVVVDEAVLVSPSDDAHHLVLETPTPFGPIRSELEPCDDRTPQTPDADPCEQFVAWYQPDHRILPLAAPFFAERFAIMHWTILTPDASVAWNADTRRLTFGPGVPREAAPAEDELEELWRSYYSSIFNPARLNSQAMRSETPVRTLPDLIHQAESRVATMVTRQQQKPTAAPFVPDKHNLTAIRSALPACKGCELYKHATQVVPGKGPAKASLMLVGEQPGDQEDRQGEPFIGPAGQLLRKALAELEIDPSAVYITNSVKHFKFVQNSKFRRGLSPLMSEITACRPWLEAEIDAIRPTVILCLGAIAAKSLLGSTFALMRDRGHFVESPYADYVMATLHPSAILRGGDEAARHKLYELFKQDIALAHRTANNHESS